MQFSKTSPLKSGESRENPVEKIALNPVTSVAVMVFSALKLGPNQVWGGLRRGRVQRGASGWEGSGGPLWKVLMLQQ